MIRKPVSRLLIFFVLLVGLGACKDKAATIPATPIARVEQMTSKLPAAADSVVVVGDLDKMRDTFNLLKTRLPDTGVVDSVQKQIQATFGIDLLDGESWQRAGLAPNTSAVGAIHRGRVLVMLYVENRQNFEKVLVEKSKSAFGIEAVTKTEKIGKHQIKVLSEDPASQIAWVYDGKLAIVSLPALSNQASLEEGSATLVLGEVVNNDKGKVSLWSDSGFQGFRKALIDQYPVALYLNPKAHLNSDAAQAELEKDPRAKAAAEWAAKNVTFLGAGLKAEGDQARVQAYAGLVPELRKMIEEAKKLEGKSDWDSYATEKMMLGARVSLNFEKAYELFTTSMPEEESRGIRRNLKMLGEGMGVDFETDIVKQLAGHAGLFFYGVAGGNPMALMAGMNDPMQAFRSLGLMVVLKFKSAEAVDGIVAKVVTSGKATVRPSVHAPEDPSFKVIAFAPGNLFIHKDTVAFATHAFGDEAMHKYLTGSRDDKKLSTIEGLELGKEFATKNDHNGVYFNSKRAQDNLGSLLAMGGVGQILNSIQEVGLSFDSDEQGVFANLTLDLVPAPKAAAPAGGDPQDKPK